MRPTRLLAFIVTLLATPAAAQEYSPRVAAASSEARDAMARFRVPDGFGVELFAAEPMLANPVVFYVDHRGQVYVAETFRHHAGVTDIREHMDWRDRDIANRTVADRVAMLADELGDELQARYGTEHERIRLLRDADRDGVADDATVFADGFSDVPDGIAAGLLEHHGDVYYTCIPTLWRLRDTDADGRADEREALSTGYGVNIALLGHDLHGLRVGPDGRLYFSSGDRGFHVETEDGVIAHPYTGAVLRCDIDGSHLEVFHTGLRNPQELAFDEYGELFTGDNNSDGGDRARVVHVVEGADSGWRYAYQWITAPELRGPWNAERLWYPHFDGQAAYVLPPIANLANGPSGLTHHPGTGLTAEYRGHFFLCDFRGAPDISGVHAFTLEPRGAGYELGPVEQFLWGTLVTDCDFGPDGALWFTDWVDGWNKTGKGRVYRVVASEPEDAELVERTRALLSEGMAVRGADELLRLLEHPDQRVRQEAQFELVARGEEGRELLAAAAARQGPTVPRLHGVWGLGMIARKDPSALPALRALLGDGDERVRAWAARTCAEVGDREATDELVALLADPSAIVARDAAIGLHRLPTPAAVAPLFELLRRAGQDDPTLRHAAVYGLTACASVEQLAAAEGDPSPDVRVGAVVALRRLASPELARFLVDRDPRVVLEAARAIHDLPLEAGLADGPAMAALAAWIDAPQLADPALARRALNATFRLGGESAARALARFAGDASRDAALRVEALEMLADWEEPYAIDRVTGAWRPIAPRDAGLVPALALELAPAAAEAPAAVAQAWVRLARACAAKSCAPELARWVAEPGLDVGARVAALECLEALGAEQFEPALRGALAAPEDALRAAALSAVPRVDPQDALPLLMRVLSSGELRERRAAYGALAELGGEGARAVIEGELRKLAHDLVPAELALDLVLAAERLQGDEPFEVLARRGARRAEADEDLAPWLDALYGGDAARGQRIYREKAELSCVRCHPDQWSREAVGPDLSGVGARLTRLQLLESVVLPNRRTAPGYESVLVQMTSDLVHAGRVVDEDAETLTLLTAEEERLELPKDEVALVKEGLSAMPGGLAQFLTRAEMRDLLEYLATER